MLASGSPCIKPRGRQRHQGSAPVRLLRPTRPARAQQAPRYAASALPPFARHVPSRPQVRPPPHRSSTVCLRMPARTPCMRRRQQMQSTPRSAASTRPCSATGRCGCALGTGVGGAPSIAAAAAARQWWGKGGAVNAPPPPQTPVARDRTPPAARTADRRGKNVHHVRRCAQLPPPRRHPARPCARVPRHRDPPRPHLQARRGCVWPGGQAGREIARAARPAPACVRIRCRARVSRGPCAHTPATPPHTHKCKSNPAGRPTG